MLDPDQKSFDADKLIYENSNTYRLHADNLRWTLLGGYAAFFAAVVGIERLGPNQSGGMPSWVCLMLFLFSLAYLGILAVQNWFYNLFARWVDDCEESLRKDTHPQPLRAFAQAMGSEISPFHPAFILAELLVTVGGFYFLVLAFERNMPGYVSSWIIWIALFLVYFFGLQVPFIFWDRLVFKGIIKPLSNLYKPMSKAERD